MKIDKIRKISLEYAQHASATPTELQKRRAVGSINRKVARLGRTPGESRERYGKYLKRPHWREFRAQVIAERGYKCEDCGATKSLHVHHKTYRHKGNEKPDDVRVLCRDCHAKIHGK